jgi:hypothetical protein
MGGEPYFYLVPYQNDLQAALDHLREREFRAGRYNPVIPFPDLPPGPNSPAPGAQHASIAEALEASDANGTRSILDLERIATKPDYGVIVPLSEARLQELFGTSQPTRAIVEANPDFWEDIERGHGIAIVLYQQEQPDDIFFAGISYD